MKEIELVIKIPEEEYKDIINSEDCGLHRLTRAIAKGTVLPKGHGDLKDADKLKHAFIKWSMAVQGFFTDSDIASIVCNSPTIIEAEESENKE